MEVMFNKKQIWAIFFNSSSKWIVKHQRQLVTSTQLAQKLLTNVQSSGGSRSFAKETRALRMSRVVVGHQKLTTTNWEQLSKLILLQLHKKLPKNWMLTILWSTIWSKLDRWKSSICWCLISWPQTQNIVVLKYHLFLFSATTTNDFRLWCVMKSGLYIWTSDDQLNDWTEKQLQSTCKVKFILKKDNGHFLVVCCPSDPWQLSESQWNHYIWELCPENWWEALETAVLAASFGQQKGPSS